MSVEQPVSGKMMNGNEDDSAPRRVDNICGAAVMHEFANFT